MGSEDQASRMWDGGGWIDISRRLDAQTPVWPGDRVFELSRRSEGDLLVTSIATTCHAGTHVDAPLHLDPAGIAVHEIPLGRLLGPAEIVRLPAGCTRAGREDLPLGWVPCHPKLLLRTDSHQLGAPIGEGFCGLSAEFVHWIADHGVVTLGIDTPSMDEFSSADLEAHHALNQRGMTWIEGLHLDGVEAGQYLLLALPLPLHGTEAAPVRALLKRLS